MKEIHLNNNQFLEDNSGRWESTNALDVPSGDHIRFTAIDKDYTLAVVKPDGSNDSFPVPNDGHYHRYEISGKKGEKYTFSIPAPSIQATVPQMIVTVG